VVVQRQSYGSNLSRLYCHRGGLSSKVQQSVSDFLCRSDWAENFKDGCDLACDMPPFRMFPRLARSSIDAIDCVTQCYIGTERMLYLIHSKRFIRCIVSPSNRYVQRGLSNNFVNGDFCAKEPIEAAPNQAELSVCHCSL
jgi:hypothetical protein